MIADKISRLTALLLALGLSAATAITACAADKTVEPTEYDCTDKNAAQVIEDFIGEYAVNPDYVAVAYKNTVTGETYCYHEDYFVMEASLYKLPLNMYWAEKVFNGEITWDEPVGATTLDEAQRQSLIRSDNPISMKMIDKIGSFTDFRRLIACYYGLTEEETGDATYLRTWTNSAPRILHCLEMLYAEPDRYPGVLDCMLQAQPDEYFRSYEDRYPIAQKYGSIADAYDFPVNAAGILYTDDPFLLVVLSERKSLSSQKLGVLAQRLCDYTQRGCEERLEREKEEAEAEKRAAELAADAKIAEEIEKKAEEAAEAERAEATEKLLAEWAMERERKETAVRGGYIWAGFGVSCLALVLIFRKRNEKE